MPVSQRGSSWQAYVTHKGERYRRNFPTKQDAQAWEADSKARLLRGQPVDMGDDPRVRKSDRPYTLKELIEHVQKTTWDAGKQGNKPSLQVASLVALLGPQTAIHKVTKGDIDIARGKLLKDGLQPASVNRKVAILSKAFTEALEMGLIDRKPKFDRYKESEHRIRRFTQAEEDTAWNYFERLGNPAMADFVILSLDTGLRQSEALNLRFRDVTGNRLTVWGTGAKSGKTRTVPLTARVKSIIERRMVELAKHPSEDRNYPASMVPDFKVFPNLNQWSVQHYWGQLREHMGLEGDKQFVPHILRHEFCSRLADAGRTAPEIMALAGHSNLTVTQKYIHINGANLDAAIATLNREPVTESELERRVRETLMKMEAEGLIVRVAPAQ